MMKVIVQLTEKNGFEVLWCILAFNNYNINVQKMEDILLVRASQYKTVLLSKCLEGQSIVALLELFSSTSEKTNTHTHTPLDMFFDLDKQRLFIGL